MSEERAAWAKAFTDAQADLPEVAKTKTAKIDTKGGGSYSYTYADLSDVLAACRPILNRHGLSVAQSVAGDKGQVEVTTRIYHEAGHVEEFGPTTLPAGSDARGSGSAVTYARRYGLCAALGIVPDEDDDGRAASRRPEPQPQVEVTPEDVERMKNRLKSKALEVAGGDKDLAKTYFESVVTGEVTPYNVEALESQIVSKGHDEAPF